MNRKRSHEKSSHKTKPKDRRDNTGNEEFLGLGVVGDYAIKKPLQLVLKPLSWISKKLGLGALSKTSGIMCCVFIVIFFSYIVINKIMPTKKSNRPFRPHATGMMPRQLNQLPMGMPMRPQMPMSQMPMPMRPQMPMSMQPPMQPMPQMPMPMQPQMPMPMQPQMPMQPSYNPYANMGN